jgi:cysteine synthase A
MPDETSMTDVVGHTPIVQLRNVVPEGAADVFVKLEWFSPTGSYKDRMALAMVEEAERRGDLRPGMTVVEYTGGSTGSSLAYICAAKGYKFKVVSSDAASEEKLRTMLAFGADVTVLETEGGKTTPDLVKRMIEQASKYASEPNTYWTDQLNNADSVVGYRNIGIEILEQLDRPIDVFCASVGTAGLAMGVSSGISSGLNVAGAIAIALELGPGHTVVTVAVDTGLKYLSGDLYTT